MYENWAVSFNCESSLYPQLNTEELDHKAKENSLACGLDAAFLPNIFRVVEKLWAVFNAEKKLLNSAQVVLTKIPRTKLKSTKNGFSEL